MNYLVLCFLLVVSTAYGETFSKVNYNLPPAASDWEVGSKTKKDNEEMIIYIPKGSSKQNVEQFFSIHVWYTPSEIQNEAALKANFAKLYPYLEVSVSVLEEDQHSVTYEWSAKEKEKEVIHGWGKIMISPDRTAALNFQTVKTQKIEQDRAVWLPVLKKAVLK